MLDLLHEVARQAEVDVVLSYARYNLLIQDLDRRLRPFCERQGIGLINASPLLLGALTQAGPPAWHPAAKDALAACAKAAEACRAEGVDIAQLAVQFSIQNADFATCIVGSADPENVRKWARWAESPVDEQLIGEVRQILEPIRDWFYIEGLPENNDRGSE